MAAGLLLAKRAASYLRISVPYRVFSSGKINRKSPMLFIVLLIFDLKVIKVVSVSDLSGFYLLCN